ncbi:hypothetical protein [Arthrobacter sp. A2-55]|uniref:hypothetical protein n=1 Tax=Arthrobacter sp. A2-55 TaxID=2897337 RepID=UPI0021CD35AC|nr:hypothetical protein [Arthrobacter sp. A2-55]MCU6480178.1 hypothetical protein [Arthrobacter sp. A2-55]
MSISKTAQSAQDQARQADGKFGTQIHGEASDVTLNAAPEGACPSCGTTDDLSQSSGLCPDCHAETHCRECGEAYNGCGDGYDGLCPDCADVEFGDDDEEDSDTVCVFDFGDDRVEIDHRGGENYSLYDENTNEHIGDFQYSGDPEDHDNLEYEAKQAIKELSPERHCQYLEDAEVDLSMFSEEVRAFPLSLYAAGGLDGDFEPYNGDIHVEDGALRYWREELAGEVVIGKKADNTYLVAYEDENSVRFATELPMTATPADINAAIKNTELLAMADPS